MEHAARSTVGESPTPTPALARPEVSSIAALCLGLAGLIHLLIAFEHFADSPAHGLFMLIAGVAQIAWVAAYLFIAGHWQSRAGLALAGGLTVLWGITRILPAPFSSAPEEVDGIGLLTKALEVTGAFFIVAAASRRQRSGTSVIARQVIGALALSLLLGFSSYWVGRAAEPLLPGLRSSEGLADAQTDRSAVLPAHSGALNIRLEQARAGPYLIRVVTAGTQQTGLFIQVRVSDAASKTSLTKPSVMIRMISPQGDEAASVVATHPLARIPTEYAALVPLSQVGVWRVVIDVEGPLGHGQTEFLEAVGSHSSMISTLIALTPLAGLAGLALLFRWLQSHEG